MFADLQFMGCGADFECERRQSGACCVAEEVPCTGATPGKDKRDRVPFVCPRKGTAPVGFGTTLQRASTQTQTPKCLSSETKQTGSVWGGFFCVFFLKTPHSSTRVVFPDFLQRPVPGEQKRTGTAVQRGATLRKENDSAGLTAEGSVAEERPDKEEEEEKAAHTCVTLSGSPKTGVT